MVSFEFSRRVQTPPNGFDLGDVRVQGPSGVATSAGQTPDQGMMIYIAVTELLDGLRRLLVTSGGQFEFIGTDSSFRLLFRRLEADRVDVNCRGTTIDQDDLKHRQVTARDSIDGVVRATRKSKKVCG